MKQINDKKKEQLISNLELCLNKVHRLYGGDSFSYAVMPILYVLVAHRHGMRFDIDSPDFNRDHFLQMPLEYDFDSESREVLTGIARCFPNLIRREISYCVADFYKENSHLFDDYYKDIVEHILALAVGRGGRYSSEYTTPTYLTQLLQEIVFLDKPHGIYDPCAGLCSIITMPGMEDVRFEGQEINLHTQVLASVRMDAHNRPVTVKYEDALSNWNFDTQCDCLFSDLPLGMKVEIPNRHGSRTSFLEDEVINKFIETPNLKRAVLIVGISTCYRQMNFSLRKMLCEKNYVDTVIELPSSVLAHTGAKPVVFVLNKEKKDDTIRFVSASDCLVIVERIKKSLDIETILNRITGKGTNQTTSCPVAELYKTDCNLAPYRYLQEEIKVLPGQKVVALKDIASVVRGTSSYDEKEGLVLEQSSYCETLADFHLQGQELSTKSFTTDDHFVKIEGPCVIFNRLMNRFFIVYGESAVFTRGGLYYAFAVKTEKCSLEYFVMLLLNSQALNVLRGDAYAHRFTSGELLELKLPMFENLESQRNLVERAYREVERELKAKIDKLQVLSGKSSDLLHNLGVTFTRMGAAVACLQEYADGTGNHKVEKLSSTMKDASESSMRQREEELTTSISTLDANLKFALRQINSTGTDFSSVTPDLEIVDIEEVVSQYVDSWSSFGYGSFELQYWDSLALSSSSATMVKIDTSLLYTALDCILANAHQHGFNRKAGDNNQVSIELKPVIINDQVQSGDVEERYVLLSVSNNGNPLPDGFTLKDFVSRGIVGINSSQDGLGGDHVCKIAHLFDGKVSIEISEQWLSFNILIPIYIAPKDTNFIEYECESI